MFDENENGKLRSILCSLKIDSYNNNSNEQLYNIGMGKKCELLCNIECLLYVPIHIDRNWKCKKDHLTNAYFKQVN